jgi:hypothetical protein
MLLLYPFLLLFYNIFYDLNHNPYYRYIGMVRNTFFWDNLIDS